MRSRAGAGGIGKPLAEQGDCSVIAEARVRIDEFRLLVSRTAWLIHTVGARRAATENSPSKIAVQPTAQWVIEHAIQIYGAGGLTHDSSPGHVVRPGAFTALRGWPEEVHRMVFARQQLKKRYRAS